ncbi:protein disulfide isomerase CRELD1 isoform X2 [Brachyhypopomus gauderio]|uniref:protein disulfide isomerase CRELD1 isoform X2 n=1 Tax=Brachyhypopomus gauderio TaxID=698409 RepID=UPI0040417CF0
MVKLEGNVDLQRAMPCYWLALPRAVLGLVLLGLTLANNCSERCKACGGPERNKCLQCAPGFTLHDNECVDVDECGTELAECPVNTYCFNTYSSYECRSCDAACAGCMGSGPARCKKCATGYRSEGVKCLDIDECAEEVLACSDINALCVNTEGSFHCRCAPGFTRKGTVCVRDETPEQVKGLLDDLQDEEVEVLKQMFFGVVLCALATLAAKGDMVFTSIFIGALAAMAGYWLSDKSDRLMDSLLKGRLDSKGEEQPRT